MSVVGCAIGAVCGQSTEEVNLAQGDINRLSVGHAWLVHTCAEAKSHTHTHTHTLNHAQVYTQTGLHMHTHCPGDRGFCVLDLGLDGGAGVLVSFIWRLVGYI